MKNEKVHDNQEQVMHPSQEHDVRVKKVHILRAQGWEPWPGFCTVSMTCAQVLREPIKEEDRSVQHALAGRLMAIRGHGKTVFARLQDRTGSVQLYFKEDELKERFQFFKDFIDLGDILWIKGDLFLTKTGEVTVRVHAFELLSKCLHPLPEKFHGLEDVETRYRQRYLDLMSNEESREKFLKRSLIVSSLRHYLEERHFIEVETPMLHPIPGGALARPFVTRHNVLASDLYLRIAPELYLKRLVIGGFERVYEINRNFRNEGVSTRHNPEFTMLEFYLAHHDYHYMMTFVEDLLRTVVSKVCGTLEVPFGAHAINFGKNFERISVKDAVLKYGSCTEKELKPEAIDILIKKHGIKVETGLSWEEKVYLLFEELVEKNIVQPTFIIDFPIHISPLAKRDSQNPEVAARFELYCAGMEIANAYNELNDPFDQEERFKKQAEHHARGNDEAHHFDADYIKALQYGLPPTVGCGIGVDRLTMLLTNTTSIKDVILFPALKKK